MTLAKSLLLGSAAGLAVVAGAQAADLGPVRKAAPVEYVRVCTAYGAGFFYIPGTDTCLRVGGRARFEYEYRSQRATGPSANGLGATTNDTTGSRGLGRLNLDARTQTSYGTLRAFVRFEIAKRTGNGIVRSGTTERDGESLFGTSVDSFGRSQTNVVLDKAFIQFAGLTAGRATSFFDFYGHDLEFNGFTSGSDKSSTNLLAYTLTFGNGFSATLSAEDPTERRGNVFTVGGTLSGFNSTTGLPTILAVNGGGGFGDASATQPISFSAFGTPVGVTFDAAGNPVTYNLLDVRQRNRLPDIVGALRVDQAWGSAQLSGAVHEIAIGQNIVAGSLLNGTAVTGNTGVVGATTQAANSCTGTGFVGAGTAFGVNCIGAKKPDAEYGFGVQGGLKINLPMIAAGDLLYLQAAYGEGALQYTGVWSYLGGYDNTQNVTGRFAPSTNDAVVDAFGKFHTTKSFSVTGAFLHYWLPELRSGFFASYATVDYDAILRTAQGPAGLAPFAFAATSNGNLVSNPTLAALSPIFRDYNVTTAGANLIWSPVKDLDIGIEGQYVRVTLDKGVVIDQTKNFAVTPAGTLVAATAANISPASAGGTVLAIPKTTSYDDQFIGRIRVQRDF